MRALRQVLAYPFRLSGASTRPPGAICTERGGSVAVNA